MSFIKNNKFAALIIAFCFSFALFNFILPLLEDVSLHFYHSVRMVNDGGLYTRWIEVMPPAIYLLYAPAVYFQQFTGATYHISVVTFVSVLSLLSIFLINRSLKGTIDTSLRNHILLGVMIAFFILPWAVFATNDRDSLFFILSAPWLINKLFRLKNGFFILLLAAIGFSIKQYNILYPLAIILLSEEFSKSYFRKIFSRENIALGAFMIILNVIFILKFPEYYTELLPVLLASYSGQNELSLHILGMSVTTFLILTYFMYRTLEIKPYLKTYILLFFTSSIVVLLNGNVFYNLMHTLSLGVLATFHITYYYKNDKNIIYTLKLLFYIFISIFFLLYLAIVLITLSNNINKKPILPCASATVKYTEGEYIYLSTKTWAFGQVLGDIYQNTRHKFAIDHLWMLPWLSKNPNHPKAPLVKDYLARKLMEALAESDKTTILVQTTKIHPKMKDSFSIFEFFRKDIGVPELSQYKKIDEVKGCFGNLDIYRKQ